jgi:hypothetical protein
MGKLTALASFASLALTAAATAQEQYAKFAIFVTGLGDAVPVAQSLVRQVDASKPFVAVTKNEDSKVVVLVTCMPRKQKEPFACMYVSHYNGATFKTFLGGGLFFSTTAELVATNFLGAIAQDIVERYNDTNIDNLRQALESCLLMTDSKCNVPDPLQKEFDAKQLTLGQYLLKKRQ